MENLWQRLKPAVRKQILAEKDLYPNLVNDVKVRLENNNFWNDLPITTARQVINFTHSSIYDISMNDFMWGDKFFKKA